jgi:hypothetical protein
MGGGDASTAPMRALLVDHGARSLSLISAWQAAGFAVTQITGTARRMTHSAALAKTVRRTTTMTLFPLRPRMTLLDIALRESLLSILAEEADGVMLSAYELSYARQAGYRLGPEGEWIAEAPEQRSSRR